MAQKKIPAVIREEVKKFMAQLQQDKLPVTAVYVFGSYAKGTAHAWSDIDVCVISSNFTDVWEALQYLWARRPEDHGLTIEPIGFSPADFNDPHDPLIQEIKTTGVRIQ